MKYPYIVFCDFDGTITNTETLSGLLYSFKPDGADALTEAYAKGEITLGECVKSLFQLVPSSRAGEIQEFITTIGVRPGLAELLGFLAQREIPFVVLSGGLRPMVQAVLGDMAQQMLAVHTAELDLSEENMRIYSQWDDGIEVVSKTQVMEKYSYGKAICIGDGYTDIRMARKCDVVFARDELAKTLTKEKRKYLKIMLKVF